MWLGSHTDLMFVLYLLTGVIISKSKFGLQILLSDVVACKKLYESLTMLTSSSKVFMTHTLDSFIAVSSAANIMLSVVLAPCWMLNSGIQNANDVLLSEVFYAYVYM